MKKNIELIQSSLTRLPQYAPDLNNQMELLRAEFRSILPHASGSKRVKRRFGNWLGESVLLLIPLSLFHLAIITSWASER